MANYFVDSTTGNNANNGTTFDLAWATLEHAEEAGGLSAGDIVWIRPIHSEIPTSDISCTYDGTMLHPIYRIGCPRAAVAITSSDWTNGSTAVVIDDGGMTQLAHAGRMITAPDGNDYFITRVVNANNIVIMGEYPGSTVTNQVATIIQDDYYDWFSAIDDSAWTIKKTDWRSSQNRPTIDFNDGNYQYNAYSTYYGIFANLYIKDSSDTAGIFYVYVDKGILISGCIFEQSANNSTIFQHNGIATLYLNRVVIIGNGSGSSQVGVKGYNTAGITIAKYVAIYNCGDVGMLIYGSAYMNNVNIGIEQANGDVDISMSYSGVSRSNNLRLGGTNGYFNGASNTSFEQLHCENYQGVLGEHRTFWSGGYFCKQSVPDGTANKKISDDVIKIVPNSSGYVPTAEIDDWKFCFLEHEIEANTDSKSYRYWIFNNAMGVLNDATAKDNIYLKVEYIAAYDDTSEYVIKEEYSSQIDIANAASADDWDYLEVTSIAPAVASKVRLSIWIGAYSASGTIYVDPAVVIS